MVKSWGEQGEEGACLGRRAVCALLSSKSPVPAEYVVSPRSHRRLSSQWRVGESVRETLHQDPPRLEGRDPTPAAGVED